MLAVRSLLAHRRLATFLCVATLLLKLLIPSGYMIAREHGQFAITVCPGMVEVPSHMPGMGHIMPDHGKSRDHGRADLPCSFAGLSAAALGVIDPVLIVVLIAFIMAAGIRQTAAFTPSGQIYWRPPLRGPPRHL